MGHAARALDDLRSPLCRNAATRAEFIALATQNISRDNPVWRGGRACDD